MEFGIISEGVTDQVVLEAIIFSYFEDNNLLINQLQPKKNEPGNWHQVFQYVESQDFRDALLSAYSVDIVIIQIDTDFMRGQDVPVPYRFETTHLSPEEIAIEMKKKLINSIGDDFYESYQDRIVFAISVDSIECWFLPAYYENNHSKASRHINCLQMLNQVLPQTEGFSKVSKDVKYYRIICNKLKKKKNLVHFGEKNFSLGLFLDELGKKCTLS